MKVSNRSAADATGCDHLDELVEVIQGSIDLKEAEGFLEWTAEKKKSYADTVAKKNVVATIAYLKMNSKILDRLVREGKIMIVGAMYDVESGKVEFLSSAGQR
jgi:carbonic anhydrase/SulP family sulfate permease